MPRSRAEKSARKRDLKFRMSTKDGAYMARCTVSDPQTGRPCGRPTARASGKGLSAFTCRYHQQHRQRHGSTWCKSPRATTLKPYLLAALAYIEVRHNDPYIGGALAGLKAKMQAAGPAELATRLTGLPPSQRADIALARLREAEIAPERLLAIVLAIHALVEDAPAIAHRTGEWITVAIAKAAHRLASGTHRNWSVPQHDGAIQQVALHKYPRSSGLVLRYLGAALVKECEWVIDQHLAPVVGLKVARYGPHRVAQ